jgi:energy-coupling factor transporter transmembrane protein EcfT
MVLGIFILFLFMDKESRGRNAWSSLESIIMLLICMTTNKYM